MTDDLLAHAKKAAAGKAVEAVRSGMVIGLGTGTTAAFVIESIGRLVQAGQVIKAVASSIRSENMARAAGIPILDFAGVRAIDLYIDGADEADAGFNLTKGGGGALVREKILAFNSERFIVVVDETKLVPQLGRFPLPVEIVPFAGELTQKQLQRLGCTATLRQKEGRTFISDNGNYILDCHFER